MLLAACASPTPDRHDVGGLGAVAAATPEATRAGTEILQAGGNAVDAAVAVSLALGVTEPAGSGIGGQVFFLIHEPGRDAVVIHGSSRAPSRLPDPIRSEDVAGRRAATIPSALRVLDLAWRRFGSGNLSWSELVSPAIRFAEDGYVPGEFRRSALNRYAESLSADRASARTFLDADGRVPEARAIERRPRLAATLRRVAESGAEDFYRGRIARQIADDMARNGGWITFEDLAGFPEPPVVPAVRGSYRGWTVHTLPPPAGGWVVLAALNILEQIPASQFRSEEDRITWVAEAIRSAHQLRLDRPIHLAAGKGDALRHRTDKGTARAIFESIESEGSGETTHFCVVDGEGVMVSVTQSLNSYYGAKVVHEDLGFLYNDYMNEFVTDSPDHPYALVPGAMPYSSMSATILSRDGRAVLGVGSPGSRRIVSAVVQVISNWVDAGMDLADAVAAPRLHVVPEQRALRLEQRPVSGDLIRALESRRFQISIPVSSLDSGGLNPYFGGVHAIAAGRAGGWEASADPRRDGVGVAVFPRSLPARDADADH